MNTKPTITEFKTPCSELFKVSNSPNYENNINHLKQKAAGEKEYGWVYKYFDGSTNFAPPTIAGQSTSNPHKVDLQAFIGMEWLGAFHNHTTTSGDESIKMFSPGDISWLFHKMNKIYRYNALNNIPQTSSTYSELFIGLVNENEVYCIKIKDFNKFRNNLITNFEDFSKDLGNFFDISHKNGASQVSFQKDLLKVIKQYDLGIGLYQEVSTGQWNELQLNTQNENNTPASIPCS